jgi:hypothetical protein
MRTSGKLALAVGVLVLLTAPARAQRPGGIEGSVGLGGGPILLIVPNVQQELKLTENQSRNIPQIIQEIMARHRDEITNLGVLTPQERVRKQREITRSMNDEAKTALSMSSEQSRRFDQIGLQQLGIEAFVDPEVQTRLKLSDEQMGKIREISSDARGRFQEIVKELRVDREEALRKIRQLQKDLMARAQAEMTDEQKASWKEMTGEPFEVRFERRPAR